MSTQVKLVPPVAPEQHKSLETPAATMPPAPANAPNTIEQVRELLYGDTMRHHSRRVADVQENVSALEQRVLQRFDEMQASLDMLARALRLEQSNALRAVGNSIVEVGRQIAQLGELRDRHADVKPA